MRAHQSKRTTPDQERGLRLVRKILSIFKSISSMYRGRVFIGDGSPTTLRYYTVMPPNNYIPGIFLGYNRISTSFDKLHPYHFCLLGPLQPIGPRLAHLHSVNKIPFAASEALTLRRLPLLVFDIAICSLVFAIGVLVFASLRFSLSSPVAPRSSPYAPQSSPLFACLCLRLQRHGLRRMRLGLRHYSLLFVFATLRLSSSSP